jgi:hypothetical protein
MSDQINPAAEDQTTEPEGTKAVCDWAFTVTAPGFTPAKVVARDEQQARAIFVMHTGIEDSNVLSKIEVTQSFPPRPHTEVLLYESQATVKRLWRGIGKEGRRKTP